MIPKSLKGQSFIFSTNNAVWDAGEAQLMEDCQICGITKVDALVGGFRVKILLSYIQWHEIGHSCQKCPNLAKYALSCQQWLRVDKAPRLIFILIQYLSNSTKQQILGRQCYLAKSCLNFPTDLFPGTQFFTQPKLLQLKGLWTKYLIFALISYLRQ